MAAALEHAPFNQAEDEERGPLRRCIVTRLVQPKETMLRFVIDPAGRVVPDFANRLPGRGLWLSARRDVLETARTENAFARAARRKVVVPKDLTDMIAAGLRRRILETLGLARRAGQAVSGFTKAREWLSTGRAGLVLQASDGSGEERARFLSGARDVPVFAPLTAAALGEIFGRPQVVHVAVAKGRLAQALKWDLLRLEGIEGNGTESISAEQGRGETNE
ncbi:MAG: RNA-binding protein [Acidobacteriia bacterium]|nr:RNA-binding protein [Methyloceanibacter sp.]MBX5471775.1 RNA-binding protein [Acetobacteraceae bacterium]MCL6491859.1 RNA-binding protein [Terriglobia bacterium]